VSPYGVCHGSLFWAELSECHPMYAATKYYAGVTSHRTKNKSVARAFFSGFAWTMLGHLMIRESAAARSRYMGICWPLFTKALASMQQTWKAEMTEQNRESKVQPGLSLTTLSALACRPLHRLWA
jgi:hypothetical protein